MSGVKSYYASASLMESIKQNKGHLADINEDALHLKDDKSLLYLQHIIQNYPYWHPDVPNDFRESQIFQDIMDFNKTLTVQESIRKGNLSELNAMTGMNNDGMEATGMENFEKELSEPAKILYLYANMGAGKTFFASLGQQLFLDWVRRKHGDVDSTDILASNLKSMEGTEYVHKIEELLKWLKSNEKPKLFLFDEASLYANSLSMSNTQNAYGSLLPIIILIRSYGGRIIFIGHSGTDLGKQMRKMATVAFKESKKKVSIYEGIEDTGEPYGKKFSLYAVPEMIQGAEEDGLIPDTEDKGSWEWTDDDRDLLEEEMANLGKYLDDADECNEDGCNRQIGLDVHGYCTSHAADQTTN